MHIKKINKFNLKELKDSPILEERSPIQIPITVVNENNELLFGSDNTMTVDQDNMVECIVIEGLNEMKSRQMCFALHYTGLSSVVGYKNFNSMDCPHQSLNGLYLWNTSQFEVAKCREEASKSASSQDSLF